MKFVSRAIVGTTAFTAMCNVVPALVLSVAVSPAVLAQTAAAPKPAASAPAKEVESLCAAQEAIVFNCRVGDKLVSICASKNAGAAEPALQYRFGLPIAEEIPELKLPVADDKMPTTVSGESGSIPGGAGSWLRFRRAPYSYTVYSATGKWGAKGEITEKQGVVVERRGANIAGAKCSGKLQSQLNAEWFTKNSVSAKDEKFTFPE